ncbi:MAG: ABC transporter permease [Armatimonadota bacterium]
MANKSGAKFLGEMPILLFFTILCIALSLTTRTFATTANLRVLGTDAAATGILSVGMTAVILTGGIDLSVAAILALSALTGGGLLANGHTIPGLLVTLMTGTMCGMLNGLLITRVGMPPIIATLGTLYVFQSAATIISKGQCIVLDPNPLSMVGSGFVPLALMLCIFAIGAIILKYTRPGRYVYAVGANEESSRLSGVNLTTIKMGVYTLTGLLAGVSAIVMLGIGSTFQANDAAGYELATIAAVVIGGTSINGGRGSVIGTLIGVGITTVLRNGAILLGLEARWAQVIIGVAIFLAIASETLRKEDSTR